MTHSVLGSDLPPEQSGVETGSSASGALSTRLVALSFGSATGPPSPECHTQPMVAAPSLPDPAVVVLAGAAGSGKSTWAAGDRTSEIVASDALRAIVGSGPADLDASVDAFGLLDTIVNARVGRSLTTVIDTLGLDHPRRLGYLQLARSAGLPAVLVIMNTSPQLCRERNRLRDRPVPAPILAEQLGRSSRWSTRRPTKAGTEC